MFAVGEFARRYATPLIALFFLCLFGYAGFKILSLQNAIDVAHAEQESIEKDLQALQSSVRTLEKVRAADTAAVKSATDGAALAEKQAKQLRADFEKVIANDEAARNFLDLPLPESIRLYVTGAPNDRSTQSANTTERIDCTLRDCKF